MRLPTRVWTAVAIGIILIPAQFVLAAPASASDPLGELDLVEVTEIISSSSVSPKGTTAYCPEGTVLIGGGGWAWASFPADDDEIVMTASRPIRVNGRQGFNVAGQEVAGGFAGNWGLDAYALCGNMPAGYFVTSGSVARSSSSVKQAIATCPDGKLAIGSGALINNSDGEVSLQTARSSEPRDIVRAVAKEDANGYAGEWSLSAFAICVDPRSGISVQYGGSELTGAEDAKSARVDCPPGTFVYDVGASTSGSPPGLLTAPPGVAVLDLNPGGGFDAHAYAVETSPTSARWDLAVQAICGP